MPSANGEAVARDAEEFGIGEGRYALSSADGTVTCTVTTEETETTELGAMPEPPAACYTAFAAPVFAIDSSGATAEATGLALDPMTEYFVPAVLEEPELPATASLAPGEQVVIDGITFRQADDTTFVFGPENRLSAIAEGVFQQEYS